MKYTKKEKAITLIALIITIIVMLILAGVTINLAVNGGLFRKARKASEQTQKAADIEGLILEMADIEMDMLVNPNGYKFDDDRMALDGSGLYNVQVIPKTLQDRGFIIDEKYLATKILDGQEIKFIDFEALYNDGLYTKTDDEIQLKIPCNFKSLQIDVIVGIDSNTWKILYYKVDGLEELQKDEKITLTLENQKITVSENSYISSITKDGVPIPVGFTYVEGSKNSGTVIQDENGNEFVWVPVNVNPKLRIKVDSNKKVRDIVVENISGPVATIPVNDFYKETSVSINKNSTYQVAINYDDGTSEYKLCDVISAYSDSYDLLPSINIKMYTSLLAKNEIETNIDNISEDAIYEIIQKVMKEKSGIELKTKLDVLKNLLVFDITVDDIAGPDSTVEEQLVLLLKTSTCARACDSTTLERLSYTDAMEEKNSVLKYGGFYIARYEATSGGTIKRGITPSYNISYSNAKLAAENMYASSTSVKSNLPSGAAWDSLTGWLAESGAKSFASVYYEGNWGNVRPSLSNKSELKTTGSSSSYKANNIYDLLGNLKEWTTRQVNGEYDARGESYNTWAIYNNHTLFESDRSTGEGSSYIGFRPILYINTD